MKTITDKNHIDRLNEKGIIIEDIFLKKGKKFIRKSDGSILDQIYNATRIEKKYYYNNKCIYKERDFDKDTNYTFATYNKNDKINCPNCGNKGTIKEFYDGCPFCGTEFNIDYGLKRHNINPIKDFINFKLFKFIVILIAIIFTLYINIKENLISENLFLNIIYSPLMLFASYFLCSIFLLPIGIINSIRFSYKESKNITDGNIKRNKIISCLNSELNHYYYNSEEYDNLIDFDIVRYYYIYDKRIDNELYADIKFKIRKYYFKNNKIVKDIKKIIVRLKYNDTNKTPKSHNIIKCINCGASMDVTKNKCEYCGTPTPKISDWVLEKL